MPRVAINGLGRIGRAALKILLDADGLDLIAVNDIADVDNLAYLLRYDTVYGRYHRRVDAADGALLVDDRPIPAFAERDPVNLPWADLGVDLTRVVDATLVKVMAWYDNEWGFTHQMIREARTTLGVATT
jgi:glyceraldehyde 3-phosphate dehydrogenase